MPGVSQAPPTPPEVLARLRELTAAPSWEALAVELGVGTRLLHRWKDGEVEPNWENAVLLLDRAGYLADGDEAATQAEQRQQVEELRQLRELVERLVRRAES
jgi:hypothetical protein